MIPFLSFLWICSEDSNEGRLESARLLGIPHTLRVSRDESTQSVVKRVRQVFGDDLPDITMECTGTEACLNVAISGTKEGGKIGLVGMNKNKVCVSLSTAGFNELELIGVRRYVANRYVLCLSLNFEISF